MSKFSKKENVAHLFEYDVLSNIMLNISKIILLLIYFAIISNYFDVLSIDTVTQITLGRLVLYTVIALLGLMVGTIASRIPLIKIRKYGQREREPDINKIKLSGLMITSYLLLIIYVIALVFGVI